MRSIGFWEFQSFGRGRKKISLSTVPTPCQQDLHGRSSWSNKSRMEGAVILKSPHPESGWFWRPPGLESSYSRACKPSCPTETIQTVIQKGWMQRPSGGSTGVWNIWRRSTSSMLHNCGHWPQQNSSLVQHRQCFNEKKSSLKKQKATQDITIIQTLSRDFCSLGWEETSSWRSFSTVHWLSMEAERGQTFCWVKTKAQLFPCHN